MKKPFGSKCRLAKLQKQEDQTEFRIDIRPLKAFVSEKLPRSSPLRALLAERDLLGAQEFLAKMETWLNLLRVT
ncbi:MAG: hypothetical protein WBV70_07865 [Candidatus Bathyarchaeia archaeon]